MRARKWKCKKAANRTIISLFPSNDRSHPCPLS
jgi:hypothetical protein